MTERKSRGYWQVWENVRQELQVAIDKLGHFPSDRELCALGIFGVRYAINNCYGGLDRVRTMMGQEDKEMPKEKPRGYWNKWGNVQIELQ